MNSPVYYDYGPPYLDDNGVLHFQELDRDTIEAQRDNANSILKEDSFQMLPSKDRIQPKPKNIRHVKVNYRQDDPEHEQEEANVFKNVSGEGERRMLASPTPRLLTELP